jgi:Tfp pilus assembly protein PilX
MTNIQRSSDRGVALLFTLFTLLILSAIAATLVTMASTETTVNSNYRSEETAFFASRAGLYEATDRMMQTNANSIASTIMSATGGPPFGAVVPSATNGGIVYLINQTSDTGTVAPWNINNKYADTELCHEGYTLAGMTNATPDVPCTTLPSGSTWYTTVTSNAPWSGTNAALPYEWVRINWKLNNSLSYLTTTTTHGVTTASTSYYGVNGTAANPICYNGANEVVLNYPTNTSCNLLTTGSTADTPVFLITALAITSTGARQMVQTEMAAPPPTVTTTPGGFSDPDGFFAAGTSCTSSPLSIAGNASTDGYSSAHGGTYSSTHTASLGSVGSNGSVSLAGTSTSVGGNIHVQHVTVNGTCPNSDVFTSGHPTYGGVVAISAYTPPVPSIPPAGTTNESVSSTVTLTPGSYGNISVSTPHGVLTLTAPGVYNINCLSVGSNSTLQISPATAQVVLNVTGSSCSGGSPVSLSANSVTNSSGVAANMMINYAGTGTITITGGASAYYVLNAPNAPVTIHGGSDLYGAVVATSIDDSGGVNLHFDNALTVSSSPATTTYSSITSSYNTIGFRTLPY